MEGKNDEQQKRYDRKPNFNTRAKLSRDGRFWIIERVETWILPRKYLDVIAQNHAVESSGTELIEIQGKPKRKGKRNADSNGQGD
ncbi:MAG: hypothetical protein JNM39_13575 [Bdellovibrionaceae bacterium]|nr:hypothetical protein [Pseudobdellovibrionaceae bacterium]